jgi:hypothetical protein
VVKQVLENAHLIGRLSFRSGDRVWSPFLREVGTEYGTLHLSFQPHGMGLKLLSSFDSCDSTIRLWHIGYSRVCFYDATKCLCAIINNTTLSRARAKK